MRTALVPSIRIADEKAVTLGNAMLAALTGNSYFPTPPGGLSPVQAALDSFTESLAKAKNGGRNDKAQKRADKKNLISLLRDLCTYINSVAKGDMVLLSTCGCYLSREPQRIVLGTPQLRVERGTTGQLISSTRAVKGAVTYIHRYTADPSAPAWLDITCTKAKCKIDGLTPGVVYSVQLKVIGTNGQVTVSNIVTRMAA